MSAAKESQIFWVMSSSLAQGLDVMDVKPSRLSASNAVLIDVAALTLELE